MSNVSIFETRWTSLIFEGRNKEYGAYKLRQENQKTTLKALFIATTLFCLVFAIPKITNLFSKDGMTDKGGIIVTPLILDRIVLPPNKNEPQKKAALPPSKEETPKKEIKKDNLTNPTVVEKDRANPDIATNKESENNPSQGTPEGTAATNPGPGSEGGTDAGNGTEGNAGGTDEEPKGPYVAASLDKLPAYPGGIDNFYRYVAKNFKTPEMDTDKAIRVHVSFGIEKDGSMTDIRVPRNPGYGLDKEAIRVLKSLKIKWSPGMIDGKPVRTAYNLPINVQIK